MKRSALVTFAAILLSLTSLSYLLLAWQANYLDYDRPVVLVQAAWGVAFGVAAAGVFARRKWARYAVLAAAGLVLAMSAAGLILQRVTLKEQSDPRAVIVYSIMAAGSGAFVALFLAPFVRDEFEPSRQVTLAAPKSERRPWTIVLAGLLMGLAAIGTLMIPVAHPNVEPAAAVKGMVPLTCALLVFVRRPSAYWAVLLFSSLWLLDLLSTLNQLKDVPADSKGTFFWMWSVDFVWRVMPPVLVFLEKNWYREQPPQLAGMRA
jgi:hypothetical protein